MSKTAYEPLTLRDSNMVARLWHVCYCSVSGNRFIIKESNHDGSRYGGAGFTDAEAIEHACSLMDIPVVQSMLFLLRQLDNSGCTLASEFNSTDK